MFGNDDRQIPDDIQVIANWILNEQCGADNQCFSDNDRRHCSCRKQIALAIFAERERCRDIADRSANECEWEDGAIEARKISMLIKG